MTDTATPIVVDADERTRALNPTTSFIVQAPAGSGKTALLTRRVLTLLATVDEPEEILALTFTRKAAAEMQTRVVEALQQAAHEPAPESSFDLEGYRLATAVLQRDAQRDWQLLQNPDRLRMSTIDALCAMLAQQLPVTSTLGGIANPMDDARVLYREAARRCLKSGSEHYPCLLSTVGNRFGRAEELLGNMLASRDQWLRYRGLFDLEDKSVLREWLEDQLADLVTRELQQFETQLNHAGVHRLVTEALLPVLQKAHAVKLSVTGASNTAERFQPAYVALESLPEFAATHLTVWQSALSCLLTGSGNPRTFRKRLTKSEGFPSSKADLELAQLSSAEAKAHKASLTEIIEALAEAPGIESLVGQLLKLPQPTYADEQWGLLEELLTELPNLERTLHRVFVDNGAIDFVEIASRARTALGEEDAPTDLALAMDLKLQHILVDEFQDTSRSQFDLFRQLVAGWQRGDGRTFFAVGDPMQSIYAFRAAEVSLFATAKRLGISPDVPLESLTLSVNFRSSPQVVNWVNNTFSNVFSSAETADESNGVIAYSASVASRSLAGCVQVNALVDNDVDEAGNYVAQLVSNTLASPEFQDDPNKRIAILVRSRTAALPIFKALQTFGIANVSVDMDSLADQPVVMDLVSLTLALRFPHSRLHWLAVLRAPWCGLCLTDLHVLVENAYRETSIAELVEDTERLAAMSQSGRARLERFWSVVQPAVSKAPRSSLVSWVEALWLQLGGPVLCQRAVEKDAAERCLKTLYSLEASGDLWQPARIQAAMERLFAVTPDDGSIKVQIMTMHKSKGLEFDTVILPALDRTSGQNQSRLLDWAVVNTDNKDNEEGFGAALLLAPMAESGARSEHKALGALVKNVKAANDDQETRRLLYVACTRAVRQLHLVANVQVKASGEFGPTAKSLLEPLWPAVQPEFDQAVRDSDVAQNSDANVALGNDAEAMHAAEPASAIATPELMRVSQDWQVPSLPCYQAPEVIERRDDEFTVQYLWAGLRARAIGTVVHRQLERFHHHGLPDQTALEAVKPVLQRQLRQQGVAEQELATSTALVVEALQNVTADAIGQWLYDSSHREAKSEWALTVQEPDGTQRRVIDRTFISQEGDRWIVDFKTGSHSGGDLEGFIASEVERHSPQLRRYAEVVGRIDTTPVRLGLYFPLLQAFREVPLNDSGLRG